ncbi:MAG: AMP-binding protein [Gammaproteobacteria bacterium]|jgi:acyl-coenzyme A synthetase/AMP-(fatty) acid ligase|nr:AMP-binding protein [Gammaproteobacteria bacterium]NCF82839.1 AMP-binding protein [Pseudomonadota bacterium]
MNMPDATYYPLLTHGPGQCVAIWRDQAVSREVCLAHVRQLAEQLPEARFAINLCNDRYVFMIALAAAMIRGQCTLLPPGRAPKLIEELAADYAGSYCLTDATTGVEGIERHLVALDESMAAGDEEAIPHIPADMLAAVVFTSGSTGRPNPNPKRWGDLVAGLELARRRFEFQSSEHETILATIPPQHMYGLEVSIVLPLVAGLCIHAGHPFFPEDIRRTISALAQPRTMFTTPTHLRACVDSGLRWPALSRIVSATAPLSAELAKRAEEMFSCHVMEIYGCTEAGSMASRRTVDGDMWQFYDGISSYEHDGVVYVSASHLPEPVPLNDFIEMQTDSRFKLLGRHADLVNIAGNRASLSDLNLKLNAIEGVRDGVFVMPDNQADDDVRRLAALVVAPDLEKKEILAALAERVNPVFLPRPLYKVDNLPRNAMGKLPREALSRLLKQLRHAP